MIEIRAYFKNILEAKKTGAAVLPEGWKFEFSSGVNNHEPATVLTLYGDLVVNSRGLADDIVKAIWKEIGGYRRCVVTITEIIEYEPRLYQKDQDHTKLHEKKLQESKQPRGQAPW